MLKTALKLLLIALATTLCRMIGQLCIPAGTQTVLPPSSFVQNGSLPLAFSLYGLFAYWMIAALFLLIEKQMPGARWIQGLSYGLSCCAVWVVYLLEPLPHVQPLDQLTYPLSDSAALLVMGLLCGLLLGSDRKRRCTSSLPHESIWPAAAITVNFVLGRLLQYLVFDSYSSFHTDPWKTLLWCFFTGITLSLVILWLNRFVKTARRFRRAATLGLLLFGVDLTLFNFFMPLVFAADIPDLIMRTAVDSLAVSLGCLCLGSRT